MSRRFDENEAIRREGHLRRLGTRHPKCAVCGRSDCHPAALAGRHPNIICFECSAQRDGRSPVEGHHPAGASNDPAKLPIPANGHAMPTDAQRGWPKETLSNPRQSPLLWSAAWFRGTLDLLSMLAALAGAVPPVLEKLDEQLTAKDGEHWWKELGFRWFEQ